MTFCSIVNIIKDKGSALHGRPGISDWIGERMRPTEEMIRTFEKDRFATCNGAVIDQVGDHYAKCSLRIEKNHRNAMGSARGDRLTAEAVCVKDGRTTSYYRIEVKDSEERLIAVVNTTGYKTAR